ncbi:MAG: hypothetical protein ACYC6J_00805 [Coriobacteriia bacterium]
MKKTFLVVALAVALTFALATTAYATSPKTWNSLEDYYSWGSASTVSGALLSSLGANPSNPGVHANYQATTAKCGICHSVHRAAATGVKLLKASTASCVGCHKAGATTITTKLVGWQGPVVSGLGRPHGAGQDNNCTARACHINNPHGVGTSTYTIFAAKLIFNGVDAVVGPAGVNPLSGFTTAQLNGAAMGAAEKKAVVAGYTCNQIGCHDATMLTVLNRNYSEQRDAMYPHGGPTVAKTGHLSVAASRVESASYAPVAGCTSCHDQTDSMVSTGGFTFPHAQVATPGSTTNMGTAGTTRAFLWMGYAANTAGSLTALTDHDMKAYDGTCLKCHRNTVSGIGISK